MRRMVSSRARSTSLSSGSLGSIKLSQADMAHPDSSPGWAGRRVAAMVESPRHLAFDYDLRAICHIALLSFSRDGIGGCELDGALTPSGELVWSRWVSNPSGRACKYIPGHLT